MSISYIHLQPHIGIRESVPHPLIARGGADAEAELARRFGKSREPEAVSFEFTDDKALLHQFYQLRVDVLNRAWGVNYLNYGTDRYDEIAHTFIARQGKLVVGGFRIVVREPGDEWKLPMEIKGFDLREALPELNLYEHRHAEISRWAILPEFLTEPVLEQFVFHLLHKCIELDLEYCFCFSHLHRSRLWRRIANNLGVLKASISDRVFPPVPDACGDMKYYLTTFERVPAVWDAIQTTLSEVSESLRSDILASA